MTYAPPSPLPTVPCRYCGLPTQMTATRLCDGCWEATRRLDGFAALSPQARARIQEALDAGHEVAAVLSPEEPEEDAGHAK